MTEKDNYTFTNPFAGDWNKNQICITQDRDDLNSFIFDTDEWDIKVYIEVCRKQKPIEVGSEWQSPGWGDDPVRVIGVITHIDQTYVAFIYRVDAGVLFKEEVFRAQFELVRP